MFIEPILMSSGTLRLTVKDIRMMSRLPKMLMKIRLWKMAMKIRKWINLSIKGMMLKSTMRNQLSSDN
jgi:ABC-type Fe3+-siderophore transport system permease subunit